MGVLGIAVLVRRDFSRQLLTVMSIVLGLVGIWILLGYLAPLYTGNNNVSVLLGIISGTTPINDNTLSVLTTGRWPIIVRAMQDIQPFGHGFSLSTMGGGIVHNIPLIIVHQIGIPPQSLGYLLPCIA
jgi:hypothetical protein